MRLLLLYLTLETLCLSHGEGPAAPSLSPDEVLEQLTQICLSGTASLSQARQFDEWMAALAKPNQTTKLEGLLGDEQAPPLKRRLAEIALDRLRQPVIYELMEDYKLTYHQWYLQKKTNWEKGVGEQGDHMPKPLDAEHLTSEWRLPWEEMLLRARWWQGKEQAAMALARIGDARSLLPVKVQLLSTLAVWDGVSGKGHIARAVHQMLKACLAWPSEEGFEVLADAYLLASSEGKEKMLKELLADKRWEEILQQQAGDPKPTSALAKVIQQQVRTP